MFCKGSFNAIQRGLKLCEIPVSGAKTALTEFLFWMLKIPVSGERLQLLPIAIQAGMDPVHFGVVVILNLGIGLITPPVGGTLFVGSAVSGVPIERLVKPLMPFFMVMVIVLLIITYVPEIVMFVPNLVMPVK